MTISNYESLAAWFKGNTRGEKPAPYWSLYSQNIGEKERVVTFNDRVDNLEESLVWLIDTIKRGNNPPGQIFRIIQTDVPRGTNPVGNSRVQIFENQSIAPMVAGAPGIGSVPIGYVPEDKVQEMIASAREKWDLEARIQSLEEQQHAAIESDPWEKIMAGVERIAQTPIGAALAARLLGTAVPPAGMPGNMTGTQKQDDEPGPEDNEFYDNMAEAAQALNTNEYQLSKKIKALILANPELAKQIFSTQ